MREALADKTAAAVEQGKTKAKAKAKGKAAARAGAGDTGEASWIGGARRLTSQSLGPQGLRAMGL